MTDELAERQATARDEWIRLCDALESAQGDELARSCRDRFQFVRTYQVYGAQFSQTSAAIRDAAAKGDYAFFRDRGVPSDVMDQRFAARLLDDWRRKIDIKKQRLSEVFQLQYHWRIDRIVASGEFASQLSAAKPMHQQDALMELAGMSVPAVTAGDITGLRAEIGQLRLELEELTTFVKFELESIKKTGPQQ